MAFSSSCLSSSSAARPAGEWEVETSVLQGTQGGAAKTSAELQELRAVDALRNSMPRLFRGDEWKKVGETTRKDLGNQSFQENTS
jgi:hypothetical protein